MRELDQKDLSGFRLLIFLLSLTHLFHFRTPHYLSTGAHPAHEAYERHSSCLFSFPVSIIYLLLGLVPAIGSGSPKV
jgi:hypothetical protein